MEMGSGYLEDCENKKFPSNIYEYTLTGGDRGKTKKKKYASIYDIYIFR